MRFFLQTYETGLLLDSSSGKKPPLARRGSTHSATLQCAPTTHVLPSLPYVLRYMVDGPTLLLSSSMPSLAYFCYATCWTGRHCCLV